MSKMKRVKDVTVGIVLGGVLFSGVSYAASATSIDVNFQPLKYFFDGVEKKAPADQQGFIYKGTTYVPLRFVSEALGKKVGYDGPTSSIYVGNQKEGSFTYIEDMKPFSSSGNTNVTVSNFVTNTGTQYGHGFELTYNGGYVTSSYNGFEREYLLNGNYKSFQAIIAPKSSWSTAGNQNDFAGQLKVFADDKVVFESGPIASNITDPVKVNIDLSGAIKLKILFEETPRTDLGTPSGGLGLLDAKFFDN
ncbi:stalk domain-containing protein [Bacillus sp. FJAT-28004]|uniref:stalk domain-containing protein n=1 Tax=Bacillus sp. FJAT-28004 TaxID=1679165 RepID=UPI0006B47E61|nr:stalk domain-containing protein [Bacillus sp. FJAT-28004]